MTSPSCPTVIIGAGGFGRQALDTVLELTTDAGVEVIGWLDDGEPDPRLLATYELPVLGGVDDLERMPADVGYLIGIADPATKRQIDKHLAPQRRPSPTIVHPSVHRAAAVDIGPGAVICPGVRLCNHVTIGRHAHVNFNCSIGHDLHLGDYSTVSPLVALSGSVHVGDEAFFGSLAAVNPGVRIGEGAVVGSGAAVVRDVAAWSTVAGVPAVPITAT